MVSQPGAETVRIVNISQLHTEIIGNPRLASYHLPDFVISLLAMTKIVCNLGSAS